MPRRKQRVRTPSLVNNLHSQSSQTVGRRHGLLPFLFMKISRFESLRHYLPQTVLIVSLLTIYFHTLAPGLTWANGGSDGGDLIAAAATGGIAHPTGYPLYLVLARLFQYLPVGSLAFRTNLMSAVFTALTAAMIFNVVTRSISQKPEPLWLPGMVAAYAFGLAPLIWSQAVITEVYALQTFLVVLILYFYTVPISAFHSRAGQRDSWRGFLLGLGMSNHVTTILIVPMALLIGSTHSLPDRDEKSQSADRWFRSLQFDSYALRRQLLWFGVGLALYLLLPLRALAHPPVNWGNPVTFERFWWLVTGQLYQSYYLQFNWLESWEHIQAGAALLLQQFGFVGLAIGMAGLIVFGSRSRITILTAWIAVTYAVFAYLYRSADSYTYLIPTFLCFAIWIGLGTAGFISAFPGHTAAFRPGIGFLGLGIFAIRVLTLMSGVDASHDLRAESFGREVLAAAPKDAILFAKGDQAVFALWYFHFALKERPDLIVIAEDLLHFDWYQETLQKTYPSLVVPDPFPWPETMAVANPLHVICYVQYSSLTDLECSGPLSPP